MVSQDDLEGYAERSSTLIDESPQMDEQNTRRKIIEPLIELLGWEILSSEVELEYSVQMGSGTKKVDYALKLEDTPVVFVEAKGCDTTITDTHVNQLKSYMRQVGVDWGLISNGKEFEIFRRDHSSSRPNEISLAKFPLSEIKKNQNPLTALSKESIDTGKSKQIAEKIESVQKAVGKLRENKEDIAEKVSREVTEEIGESVSQRVEDEAKSFVDDLIASLDAQAHRAGVGNPSSTKQSQAKEDYLIQLLNDGEVIKEVQGNTQSEVMAQCVAYLIEERGLLEEIEIPYIPGTGKGSRALINEEPTHPSGERMRLYKELPNGYYLFTSLNAESKERYISELSEKCGCICELSDNWR